MQRILTKQGSYALVPNRKQPRRCLMCLAIYIGPDKTLQGKFARAVMGRVPGELDVKFNECKLGFDTGWNYVPHKHFRTIGKLSVS